MNAGEHKENYQQHIERLKAELLEAKERLKAQQQRLAEQQKRNAALRQEIAQQFGQEILALIDGDPRAKVFVTNVVEKLVFRDEQGNVLSKSDAFPVRQIVEVKLVDLQDLRSEHLMHQYFFGAVTIWK